MSDDRKMGYSPAAEYAQWTWVECDDYPLGVPVRVQQELIRQHVRDELAKHFRYARFDRKIDPRCMTMSDAAGIEKRLRAKAGSLFPLLTEPRQ